MVSEGDVPNRIEMKILGTFGLIYIGFSLIFTTIWSGIWLLHSEKEYEPGTNPTEVYKLFNPMLPTTMIPNYFKGTVTTGISASTMITIERLNKLKILVANYQGPVSCVLHVSDESDLNQLLAMDFTVQEKQRLYLHVIIDKFDRQFNLWRNMAKYYSPTDALIMLDIDFYICNLNEIMIGIDINAIIQGSEVYVIPAFEFSLDYRKTTFEHFPSNKYELIEEMKNKKVEMFHSSWVRGHKPTNYTKWFRTDVAYPVKDYTYNYEPYLIMGKNTPYCDERFIGYGSNKAACVYQLYLHGISFLVHPKLFLIHQYHTYPEADRSKEREYNRLLYEQFRLEMCIKYMRMKDKTTKLDGLRDYMRSCSQLQWI